MWYLQKPTDEELNNYVSDMSAKIKATRAYSALQAYFDCEIYGHRYDFVDMLLRCKPQYQLALNRFLMERIFNHQQDDDMQRKIKSAFNYTRFISQDSNFSYALSRVKKINACPYCNRQYTLTIEKKTTAGETIHIAKPHFDHWFAKSDYPLLSLSFYNLIPSCSVCNSSIKGNGFMGLNDHIHPYCQEEGYEPHFKFRVLFTGGKDFELYTTKSVIVAEEQMKTDFFIDDVYKYHKDLEVADLVTLYLANEGIYLRKWMTETLKELRPAMTMSEIIRMVFGAEMEASRLKDRPLSKLKKDLLEQFHVI